jgi:cyclic pyranopterin phosphate synthase
VTEIRRLVRAFVALGVSKVRLTGGEPTLRRDLCEVISEIRSVQGVQKIALSTNGHDLAQRASDYSKAGVRYLNISVDSMNAETFKQFTGRDHFERTLNGLEAALAAGFASVKINAVLMRGLNDHELSGFMDLIRTRPVSVRFIELMQTGAINADRFHQHHISTSEFKNKLLSGGWTSLQKEIDGGPADEFTHPNYLGRIGLIAPYAPSFCDSCNRLRVSSQGRLQMCLFSAGQEDLRDLLQDDSQINLMHKRLQDLLTLKPAAHRLHESLTGANQTFSAIGG